MTYLRVFTSYPAVPAVFVAILLINSPLNGQTTATKSWTQSRTPDGQPDIQGIWNNSTLTPLERPRDLGAKQFFTKEEAAERVKRTIQQSDGDRRDGSAEQDVDRAYNQLFYDRGTGFAQLDGQIPTSLIIDPPDGRIPALTPEAEKREAARREARSKRGPADSWTDRNLAERCLSRGAPKLPGGYNNNVQIVQTRDSIMMMQEMLHEVRIIHMDGRAHLPSNVRLWLGDSIGHWERDTLVVDTTNYKDDIRFASFNCCGPAGEGLHIVERFRRVDEHTIDYRYTVNDATTYTKPWTVAVPMTRIDERLYEYACHEGNYAMEGMLKGARAEEAKKK
jgi:hypothetical protein